MPAPKNPESYSVVYNRIAQFCKENPLEELEFKFKEKSKALTFRRNLYGYITALSRAGERKNISQTTKDHQARNLNALRARKIVMEESEGEIIIRMIPRDIEDLSEEVGEQLNDQWEKIREEGEEEEGGGEMEEGVTQTEELVREKFSTEE